MFRILVHIERRNAEVRISSYIILYYIYTLSPVHFISGSSKVGRPVIQMAYINKHQNEGMSHVAGSGRRLRSKN